MCDIVAFPADRQLTSVSLEVSDFWSMKSQLPQIRSTFGTRFRGELVSRGLGLPAEAATLRNLQLLRFLPEVGSEGQI